LVDIAALAGERSIDRVEELRQRLERDRGGLLEPFETTPSRVAQRSTTMARSFLAPRFGVVVW
jgi:hypothetical protein